MEALCLTTSSSLRLSSLFPQRPNSHNVFYHKSIQATLILKCCSISLKMQTKCKDLCIGITSLCDTFVGVSGRMLCYAASKMDVEVAVLDPMKSVSSYPTDAPQVSIIMGSDSDLPVMKCAEEVLKAFDVRYEITIVSAHRTPERMFEYAKQAQSRGIKVIIAGAGGAAHLPGMVASMTTLPVIGVPIKGSTLDGMDSLLSIVQMPKGVPVATVQIDNATNAGMLAVRMLACKQSVSFANDNSDAPQVGFIMGSDSDLPVMKCAAEVLKAFDVQYEVTIVSTHQALVEYAKQAHLKGIKVIIAGAGGATHLLGTIAEITELPVIGVPIKDSTLDEMTRLPEIGVPIKASTWVEMDSLLSIIQLPKDVPIAIVGIENGTNAGLLAVRMLGNTDTDLQKGISEHQSNMNEAVLSKIEKLEIGRLKAYLD